LLVRFAAERLKKRPSDLAVEDIESELVLAFLDHTEGTSMQRRAPAVTWDVDGRLGRDHVGLDVAIAVCIG
jgi:hypothetical protein